MEIERRRALCRAVRAVLAGVVLAVCPRAGAQESGPHGGLDLSQYAHTAWKVRDGFVKGAISSIAQTPDGYLWLGTEYGLYRFDGVRAIPWQPPAGQQLPSNFIGALLAARDGTLWIGTLKGLASWKDGQLKNYPELAGLLALRLLKDPEERVWVGTAGPGRLCAVEAGKVQCYGDGSFGNGVDGIYEDHKGGLWVAAETGVWRWKPGPPENYRLPRAAGRAHGLAEDDAGTLLLATSDGLKQLVGRKIQNYALPGVPGQFRPSRFLRCKDGGLWLGSGQGLWHLHDGKTDGFGGADGLSGDVVDSIFEDREGAIWVATIGGLDRFREYAVPRISTSQGLSTNSPYSIQATTDGAIWIATSDGLNRWESGRVTVYGKRSAAGRSGTKGEQRLNVSRPVTEIANSGLAGALSALGLDDQGRLYVSDRDGISYFDGKHFVRVPNAPGGNTWSIAGDGHGKLWMSDGNAGLFYFAPGDAVQPIPWLQLGQKGFGARALLADPWQGGVWLGFYDGGVVYVKDGKAVRSYGAADGLGNGRVNQLHFGSRMPRAVWAATEGGLSRIKDDHIETLSSKNGLPCDEVHWSVEDDEHAMWVFMPCGLARIERSEWYAWIDDPRHVIKTTFFDSSDGVPSVGVYGSSGPRVTKAPDGKIWFVQRDGVSVIDPRHLPYNKLPPPVHIEQVIADRKSFYDMASAVTGDANKRLRLPALSRDLQIDYTALSLVAPEKVQFRYKLEGWDEDWQEAGNRRQVFYTGLKPRKYRFRVKACNNSGVWNEAGAVLDFSVAPAYYQSWWFRLSGLAVFSVFVWVLYQMRLRQVADQVRHRLLGRVEERERIARDLHDTFLQSVQGLVLKFAAVAKQIPREEPARGAMEDALDQADNVLAEGRDRVRSLRTARVGRGELPMAFQIVAEQTGYGPGTTFKTVIEGSIRELDPMIREETYAIGREAIINALTHSGGLLVEVEIGYDSRQFRVRIRDDGRGIDPGILEKGGRKDHWGLRGMRERASKIGGRVTLWSRPGTGTEVEFSIPAATAYRSRGARSKMSWFRRSSSAESERV